MHGGKGDVIAIVHLVGVRRERHLIEIIGQRRLRIEPTVIFHRRHKFVDVRALVDTLVAIVCVRLAHFRIFNDPLYQLVHGHILADDNPVFDQITEACQLFTRRPREPDFVNIQQSVIHRQLVLKRVILQRIHRFRTDTALWKVDDTQSRFAVERIVDKAQIRQQIFDFLALEELKAAEYFVGDTVPRELLFERPRERVQAHQNGKIGIAIPLAEQTCDALCDIPRLAALFFRLVHFRFRALFVLRPQRFILAVAVVFDDGVGKVQNVLRRTVVAL